MLKNVSIFAFQHHSFLSVQNGRKILWQSFLLRTYACVRRYKNKNNTAIDGKLLLRRDYEKRNRPE